MRIHHGVIRTAGLVLASATFMIARPAAAQMAPKLDDPTIVAIFDAANTWDMETSGLAAKRATTKELREFAAMLVRDHKGARTQGRALAKKLGVTPTPPKDFAMAKDHHAAWAKLKGLRGKAFDRAYLEHEVAYHKAVIEAVTSTLLPGLKNQEVKDLVTKVAPAFKAHLDAAQDKLDKLAK